MTWLFQLLSQGWFGTVTGVVGTLLAFWFYLRSEGRPQLAFQYDHVTLVGGREPAFPAELEIRFNGLPVPRVTTTRLVLWNSGNRTIRGADVVEKDPLRIEIPEGCRVLKYSVLKVTRDVTGVVVRMAPEKPHQLCVTFDYLDPDDGMALEVIHSSPLDKVSVLGSVRGMPRGIANHGRVDRYYPMAREGRLALFSVRGPVYAIAVALGVLMALFGVLRPQLAGTLPTIFGPTDPSRYQKPNWILVIVGIVYAAVPSLILWSRRRRHPAGLAPLQHDGEKAEGKVSA